MDCGVGMGGGGSGMSHNNKISLTMSTPHDGGHLEVSAGPVLPNCSGNG